MRLPVGKRGFTLVELLVVIAIIAILASIVLIIINPLEITKRSRDALRFSDLHSISQAISVTMEESKNPQDVLCSNVTLPCSGVSNDPSSNNRMVNGTGWIKVNFSGSGLTFSVLPVDPINNPFYHYTYNSDGDRYEISGVLESGQFGVQSSRDGGNNPNVYEIGTDLNLIN